MKYIWGYHSLKLFHASTLVLLDITFCQKKNLKDSSFANQSISMVRCLADAEDDRSVSTGSK